VEQLPDVHNTLEAFTDKMAIVVTATNLLPYLSDVWSLYNKACQKHTEHTTPAATMSGSTDTE